MDPISVAVSRGSLVESRRRVHAVAVRDGRTVMEAGDPALVTLETPVLNSRGERVGSVVAESHPA